MLRATTACTLPTSQRPKVVRTWCVFFGQFDFDICFAPKQRAFFLHVNVQNAPELRCFPHFDLDMSFAPEWCALFQHLKVQKCSRAWCVLHVLTWKRASRHICLHVVNTSTAKSAVVVRCFVHATTACTFSTSQLPKVCRAFSAFTSLIPKCVSSNNAVQFFIISTSKGAPRPQFLAF